MTNRTENNHAALALEGTVSEMKTSIYDAKLKTHDQAETRVGTADI